MTDRLRYPLLDTIKSPDDLMDLDTEQLILLAAELRSFLLHTLDKTGGHLSSNLGTVELTIALHKTFNTPYDKIIWDVGHQAYPHKILTGRAQQLGSIRKKMVFPVFQNVQKVPMMLLVSVIPVPLSAQLWVWQLQPNRKALSKNQ